MGPQKYRKKPVVIEAIQWTGDNGEDIGAFCPVALPISQTDSGLSIATAEGDMRCEVSDWIIKGVRQPPHPPDFYPCKPDVFEATYEEA